MGYAQLVIGPAGSGKVIIHYCPLNVLKTSFIDSNFQFDFLARMMYKSVFENEVDSPDAS